MCGIAGQVRADGRRIEPELLRGMCAAIEHRGPDARGEFMADGVALGIQRLRVIDLETGDQPIANEDGTVVVVLNGEIYNYRELRARARSAGATASPPTATPRRSSTSTRSTDGDCVRHLHGMFAFALWDARRRRLLLATRPRGQEAALLRRRRRAPELRVRAPGAARGRDGLAGGRSPRRSTATSPTATSRLRRAPSAR